MLVTRFTRWPSQVPVEPRKPPVPAAGEVVVTFIGHATFLIQSPGGNVLTDPVYSQRAGPLHLRRTRPRPRAGVRFEDLPPISTVLLSHNHYDHCDLRALRRLERRFDPLVVTPLGNARLLRSAGPRRVEELDWWESDERAVPITVTPAQHFSARTPFDRNRALWGGFVVEIGGRRILLRRRLRLRPALPRDRRPPGADRPRAAADRRLRAALVHAGHPHESGGGGAGPPRPRRSPEHRDALRHLSADAGGDR